MSPLSASSPPIRAPGRPEGERNGAYFPAGVLTGLTTDHVAAREEFFGPVAMIFPAIDEDDALRIANYTPYGLGNEGSIASYRRCRCHDTRWPSLL
ncbi:aldehyde dehydrogenase family protein [Streptomyces sp. NPDC021012]|uniref:aldehyde dehydrogenase family protein n=1 Tax=unclassified Streptomyces TaxID=2593676 RepID=UPI0037A5272F